MDTSSMERKCYWTPTAAILCRLVLTYRAIFHIYTHVYIYVYIKPMRKCLKPAFYLKATRWWWIVVITVLLPVLQTSQLSYRTKGKNFLIVCFDFKLKLYISTNVFDPSCYHSLGEEHISTESTKHSLTNFISHDLLFFVILREITNLILTVPSLDV